MQSLRSSGLGHSISTKASRSFSFCSIPKIAPSRHAGVEAGPSSIQLRQNDRRQVHRRAVQPTFFGFSFGQSDAAVEAAQGESSPATRSIKDVFSYDVGVRSRRTAERMSRCETIEEAMTVYIRSRDKAIDLNLPCFDVQIVRDSMLVDMLRRQIDTSQQLVECVEAVSEIYTDMFRWKATTAQTYLDVLMTFKGWIQGRPRDGALLIALRGAIVNVHRCLLQENEDQRGVHNMVNITALMNAYNHVGLAQSALEIWQRLLISHSPVEPATVSVVFDTCGFSGLLQDAQRAFAYVSHASRKDRLMDKNVWDAYLECLARCNQLRSAIDLALHQMAPALQQRDAVLKSDAKGTHNGRYDDANCEPDSKTFRILLQFAAAKKDARSRERDPTLYHDLRREIQALYPQHWAAVQHIGVAKR